MPDTESDHHRDDAAVARLDLVAPPAARPATTSSSRGTATTTATARNEDEEDGFTFAAVAVAVPRLQAADIAFPDARVGGPVYPVFGRPRWPPPKQHQQEEEEEEDPAGSGKATGRRVPLGRLLLEERWCDDCAPSVSGQQPADAAAAEAELDGVPAETYCLWSPGASPPAPAGSSPRASPPRCRMSGGSTGSSVLRWRRQRRVVVGRSYSDDGKDRFVFLGTSTSSGRGAGEGHGRWMNPCKQHLVGLVASAITFRRSCYPF